MLPAWSAHYSKAANFLRAQRWFRLQPRNCARPASSPIASPQRPPSNYLFSTSGALYGSCVWARFTLQCPKFQFGTAYNLPINSRRSDLIERYIRRDVITCHDVPHLALTLRHIVSVLFVAGVPPLFFCLFVVLFFFLRKEFFGAGRLGRFWVRRRRIGFRRGAASHLFLLPPP